MVLVGRGDDLARAADRFPATEVLDLDLTDPASVDALKKVKVDTLIHTVGAWATSALRRRLRCRRPAISGDARRQVTSATTISTAIETAVATFRALSPRMARAPTSAHVR